MIISLIAAMDEQRGIGFRGKIPWLLSTDLKRFKRITMGHHIIMGRITFESIGRPLQGRKSIVLSRHIQTNTPDVLFFMSLDEAISVSQTAGEEEVFIIGGSQVFAIAIDMAQRLYITLVHANVEADSFFPDFDPNSWRVGTRCYFPADKNNQYSSEFIRYLR